MDLAAVDDHGETVLHLAIRGGSVDWCEITSVVIQSACLRTNFPSNISRRSVLYLLSLLDHASVPAASSGTSAGSWTCLRLCYVARQQVARIVVDSIAAVVYTAKLSQLLHALAPAFDTSALINHANKLKETALHMACMMERSKVTPWLWMHASLVLIVP